jgi:hypothetical protein
VTQTPPAAPAQGISGTPATVTVGVLTTIPIPRTAAGGPQPTPYTFPWVVLLNASPYTIVVSSGATVTQIAAFNSDKVYIYPGGGPQVTFVAVAGVGSPAPGTDSTVYSTFYHDEPPGTYPAFIGPGAPLAFNAAPFAPQVGVLLNAGISTRFPTVGGFSSTGFAGLSCQFSNATTSTGPLSVTVQWTDSAGNVLSQRNIVVPVGVLTAGVASFTIPHEGPLFNITVTNLGAGALTYSAVVNQTTVASASWNANGFLGLIPITATSCPNATPTVAGLSNAIYAGPVSWFFNWNNTTAGHALLQFQDGLGGWNELVELALSATSPTIEPLPIPLIVPANPLRVQVNQTSGGPTTVVTGITADDYRYAA